MAVGKIATTETYQGLSTDDKPMEVHEGSTFHAVDTGEEYVFMDGMWEQDLRRITALKMAAIG